MNDQPTALDVLVIHETASDGNFWHDDDPVAQFRSCLETLNIPPDLPVARLRQALDLLERVEGMEKMPLPIGNYSGHRVTRSEGWNDCLDAVREGLT